MKEIVLYFSQRVSTWDIPITLSEWRLDEAKSKNYKEFRKAMADFNDMQLMVILFVKGLLQKTKEKDYGLTLTNYICIITEEQAQEIINEFSIDAEIKKILQEKEELMDKVKKGELDLPLSLEETKKHTSRHWLSSVRVDELGYFSNCPNYCDDCMDLLHIAKWSPDFPDLYKKNCAITFVKSPKTGKVYTYYLPNDKIFEIWHNKYKKEVLLLKINDDAVDKIDEIRKKKWELYKTYYDKFKSEFKKDD